MNCLDLFSGAGGLTEGFVRAGYNIIAHVEKEFSASLTLKTRIAYHYLKQTNQLKIYYSYLNDEISREKLYSHIPSQLLDSVINEEINDESINDIYNKITVTLYFRDCGGQLKYSDVTINVDTTNQENEAHNIYSTIMNTLENNPDRYDKTIKHRKIRTQCFTISVGIILSYILYIILKINADKISPVFAEYLNNKYILVFGQWFVAILLGNVLSYWYILSLYRPLLPETKYAGFNYSTNRGKYTDDVDDFIEHSEVHFGKYWDAEKRRNRIEKIYKITKIILLLQLVISAILFLAIK